MSKVLLSACAAALVGIAASSAHAADFTILRTGPAGAVISVADKGPSYGWPNRSDAYGHHDGWKRGWGKGYAHARVVPTHQIVRKLARQHFTHISRPVLAGNLYQVKARDSRGRKVKLYVNAYTGEIARWKFRG